MQWWSDDQGVMGRHCFVLRVTSITEIMPALISIQTQNSGTNKWSAHGVTPLRCKLLMKGKEVILNTGSADVRSPNSYVLRHLWSLESVEPRNHMELFYSVKRWNSQGWNLWEILKWMHWPTKAQCKLWDSRAKLIGQIHRLNKALTLTKTVDMCPLPPIVQK